MAHSKYIKTKSNYVLNSKHQTTKDGVVYERDFMTITGPDTALIGDDQFFYRSSNFKFVVRSGINQQKKHTNGEWNDASALTISTASTSTDTSIVFNPDYESMTDFAYYGSAVDLVRASIVDIVLRFPAELYFSEETMKVHINGVTNPTGDLWHVVSNDFGIDIYTEKVDDSVENKLRYLTISSNEYEPYNGTTVGDRCVCDVTVVRNPNADCYKTQVGGTWLAKVTIKLGAEFDGGSRTYINPVVVVYKLGDEIYYLYSNTEAIGYHLRPKKQWIDEFYNSIDDFQKVILNRTSIPSYTCTFNTPYETDNGFFTYKKKYTWPSQYGWNPDLSGLGYETYVGELISLASFHDEYNTNNIWRSMTHEAIKNLDWTFKKETGDDVEEIDTIDTSKIEPILKIYGRQYDDLKRSIDNITKSSTVTLDKKNNVPDYFLDDTLNLSGWETKEIKLTNNEDEKTLRLYPGVVSGYGNSEANTEFMRRLKVMSPYIMSMKGTTRGMETLLGVFGMTKDVDYNIDEYVAVASGNVKYELVTAANTSKYTYMESEDDVLQGIPVERPGDVDYVVPFFDKNKKYDGDLYFQAKGGWGKHQESSQTLYDETVSVLKTVRTLEELVELGRYVVKTGDICYVNDITNLSEYDEEMASGTSHYFYLVDDEYVNVIGTDEENNTGWVQIDENNPKVLQVESIIDDSTGNNPHTGNGGYDDGDEYINNMLKPLMVAIDENGFVDDEAITVATSCTFSARTVSDNQKCWFFSDEGIYIPRGYVSDDERARLGLYSFDGESTDGYDESCSDSAINIKKMVVNFKYKQSDYGTSNYFDEFKKYVKETVLFYLKQIIPSTTIFEYNITEN